MSIWLDKKSSKVCDSLDRDIECDVLIIGGGIAGVSILYELLDSGLNVVLVEKNKVGEGVSSRTTGKLTFLQDTIYGDLEKTYGRDVSKLYYESQKYAIDRVKEIVNKEKIDCNLVNEDSYLFTDKHIEKIDKEKMLLESFGVEVFNRESLPDGLEFERGISVDNTYTFHPVKYINALKDKCTRRFQIYENTRIVKIDKKEEYFSYTDDCKIKSKIVIVAMHYPYFLFPFLMPLRVSLEKSYLSAYKVKENLHFSAINIDKPSISIRYYDNYKLVLSNSHKLGFNNNDKNNFEGLKYKLPKTPYKVWSNKDIMTSDGLGYIGLINDGMYLVTGFNTWGMTNGILSGIIIKDLVLNKYNRYSELFSPKRKLKYKDLINYPINIFSSVKAMIDTKVVKNKTWYSDRVWFGVRDGINVAVYIDDLGNEHVVRNLCPHLKCSLLFNEEEKTWDCPCHGSRFNIDGKCIEGPSNYDISI